MKISLKDLFVKYSIKPEEIISLIGGDVDPKTVNQDIVYGVLPINKYGWSPIISVDHNFNIEIDDE